MFVMEYLQKAKALADDLQAGINAIVYRNIGSDFHSIITALNLRTEPVSFFELPNQLVAHGILLKS